MKRKLISALLALAICLTLMPTAIFAADPEFYPGDIAIINGIIDAHPEMSPKLEKAPPSGYGIPAGWDEIIDWTEDTFNKRVKRLFLVNRSLEGSLDVTGLDAMTRLDCHANKLASLKVSTLKNLEALQCYDNNIKSLELNSEANYGLVNVSRNYFVDTSKITNKPGHFEWGDKFYTFSPQKVCKITFDKNGGAGTMEDEFAFWDIPYVFPANEFDPPEDMKFKSWAIGSAAGTPKAPGGKYTFGEADGGEAVTVYALWKPAAAPGDYNVGDIAVINGIIDNNGLNLPKAPENGSDAPPEWVEKVIWNDAETGKRIIELNLWKCELTGDLNLNALEKLEKLNCGTNNLTSLDISELAALEVLECYHNRLTGLVLNAAAPYNEINVRFNIMADESAITGREIPWDTYGNTYFFTPQRSLVTFDNNGGTGEMDDELVLQDSPFELPECAFTPPQDMRFKAWAIGALDGERKAPGDEYTFTKSAAVYAIWKDARNYAITVVNGSANPASAESEVIITIKANPAPSGYRFKSWTVNSGGAVLTNPLAAATTFEMPANPVRITANYERILPPDTYYVNVINGASSASEAKTGAVVTITADPAPEGKRFREWSIYPAVTFAYATSKDNTTAHIIMPAGDVIAEAKYEIYDNYAENYTGGGSAGPVITPIPDPEPVVDPTEPIIDPIIPTEPEPEIPAEPEAAPTFSDVSETDWFAGAVAYVAERGIMQGTGDGLFSPNLPVTRGMLVTMLYRLNGSPEVTADLPFADVDPDSWYYAAIRWAYENGIILGISDTEFGAGLDITREQLVTILYRYALKRGLVGEYDVTLDDFADKDQISPWAAEAMLWAKAEGIISGVTADTLDPQGAATRAQVAAIFQRFMEKITG
ncbi:MAG TPA: hypothetical protein GX704_05645 [Clostridiales bacterium]|nr:hypothetical protein [Clostridiales bacterium]